jgi:hypothetical protein
MHDCVHGCLVSFHGDDSDVFCAVHSAARPAPAGNPRITEIQHPLCRRIKP